MIEFIIGFFAGIVLTFYRKELFAYLRLQFKVWLNKRKLKR